MGVSHATTAGDICGISARSCSGEGSEPSNKGRGPADLCCLGDAHTNLCAEAVLLIPLNHSPVCGLLPAYAVSALADPFHIMIWKL